MCEFDGELRDLGPVATDRLALLDQKLADHEALWASADGTKPNNFGVFAGSTLHIVFQYPVDLNSHLESRYAPFWEEWRPVLEPLIGEATAPYRYSRGRTARVMLARLLGGKAISRHVDASPSAAVPHKIHIPIVTNPAVRFGIGDGEYDLIRGRAYEVNNRRPHAVRNDGSSDRIHLIFDYFDAA